MLPNMLLYPTQRTRVNCCSSMYLCPHSLHFSTGGSDVDVLELGLGGANMFSVSVDVARERLGCDDTNCMRYSRAHLASA